MAGRSAGTFRIGCAGWSIPRDNAPSFSAEGSHLARYSQRLTAVEINTSFYRPHRAATYERWANAVPDQFRFAVKIPRTITHETRLENTGTLLEKFLGEASGLGKKLGVLLVQLPPSLQYSDTLGVEFFTTLRELHQGPVVCEPRHPTWFTPAAETLLRLHHVARVAASPAPVPAAATPGGWPELVYYRLHGAPKMYYSSYPPDYLERLNQQLRQASARGADVWCIFDNTAAGFAVKNALDLLQLASAAA